MGTARWPLVGSQRADVDTACNGGQRATPFARCLTNSIGRNALGIPAAEGHLPCMESDGSLVLYVQHDFDALDRNDPWIPPPVTTP